GTGVFLPAVLAGELHIAELARGLCAGVSGGKTGALEVGRAHLEVEAQLVVEVGLDLGARAPGEAELHAGLSTRVTASAYVCQVARSVRSRARPAAVSA